MIGDILVCFALQTVFTIGIIFLFGFAIAQCNKQFYANFGRYSRAVCYATGIIGVPIHECSHALFCLIFGHKIIEIEFFDTNSGDGTLGHVTHSYNERNIYQRVGNFFIGVAPIVVISAVLYLLAWLLLPNFVASIGSGFVINDFISDFGSVFSSFGAVLSAFFVCATTWQWWVFVLIGMFLALHMTLSGADIRSALSGLLVLLAVFFIVDLILGLVSKPLLDGFTQGVLAVSGYLMCILVLALTISLIALIVSFVFRIIRR